ncbi:hypothetical protein BpOF4_05235 [Alkalihalophilus pseudofirmus OF4]|uniref:Uncharacterized protein n=1 Tax=Alkalihalophilus pseudofirmus (strain ATCC BAA-2126 / JCM 17055 / OF4) TaxID=398511 RepID=D3FY86_ALKPO|nr:hypothetical protein [Alkalihalophilus pseudofirmus]ADC49109.1 hypothetical protein BpOF4_05235 [Alkalihalophilus pseudofirmus OF4]
MGKGLLIVSFLLSVIVSSYSHVLIPEGHHDHPAYITHELEELEKLGGLSSGPTIEYTGYVLKAYVLACADSISAHLQFYLKSSIPLLKIKCLLMTIKYQSTFFAHSNVIHKL